MGKAGGNGRFLRRKAPNAAFPTQVLPSPVGKQRFGAAPKCWRGKALTEHRLQAHEAADEGVEVDGQVGLRIAGDEQLMQLLAQLVAFWGRSAGSEGGLREGLIKGDRVN